MQPQRLPRSPLLSVLQDGNFRILWYVIIVKQLSHWFELLVLSWLVLQATDSPLQLALVWVSSHSAIPLVSLFSGVLADRVSRQRILLVAQSLNTLIATSLLLLIVSNVIQPWHIFIAAFLQGIAQFLEFPSRRTAILDIIGARRAVNALSLDNMAGNAGRIAGPFLGGLALQLLGYTEAYAFAVMMHLLALGLLTRVKIPTSQGNLKIESMWSALAGGIRYALHNRTLLGVLYISMVINALALPAQQFLPAIGRDILGVGPALVGLLASSWAFGQLVFSGVMASTRDLRYQGRVFVVGSTVSLMMVSLFVWSPWYALSFALLIIVGMGNSGFGTMQSPLTMLSAPQEMRGTMMGLLSFCIGVSAPLGTLEIGLVAAAFSTQWAISLNAIAGLVLLVPAVILTPLVWQPLSEPLSQRL